MGFNTNITICNDFIGDYRRDPARFTDFICTHYNDGGDFWGITVLPSEHADGTQLVAAGGNFATKLYTGWYSGSHHTEEGQVALLRQWADSLGYRISKKPGGRSMKATRFLYVYEALDGFRWHLVASGRIVSESGQRYTRRHDARKAALKYGVPAGEFPVVLVDGGSAERVR